MNITPHLPTDADDQASPEGMLVRWRTLVADLIDMALIASSAMAVGMGLYALLEIDDPAGFENLGVWLLAAAAGGFVALGSTIAVVIRGVAGRASVGHRIAKHAVAGGWPAAGQRLGRWLLIGLGLSMTLPAVRAIYAPHLYGRDLASVARIALLAVIAATVLAWVYSRPAPRRWWLVGRVALSVGTLAAAGAASTLMQPLRPYELDTVASEEVVRLLEDELAATRVCDASHAISPCFERDEVWQLRSGVDESMRVLVAGVERVIGSAATVRSVDATTNDDRPASRLVAEPGSGAPRRTIVLVAETRCGTRVWIGDDESIPVPARRFLPDVAVTQPCA